MTTGGPEGKMALYILHRRLAEIVVDTDSPFLSGSDITYSGGRGSSALRLTGTARGAAGGFSNIHSVAYNKVARSASSAGVVGIKQVTINDQAMTDGSLYGGQFVAKHASATATMAAEAALIGLESWAYVSAAGCANTAIGGNFGWHNEATGGDYAVGSVIRGVQIFCDNNAGGNDPDESTGLCIWNQAGTITNAINVVNSGSGFTNFLNVSSAAGCAAVKGSDYSLSEPRAKLTVKVGASTYYLIGYTTAT
jgi:hypothetical protein